MSLLHGEQPRPSAPSADVDAICDAFEAAWLAGQEPRIEDFLPRGDPLQQDGLLRELLLAEWDLRRRHGQHLSFRRIASDFQRAGRRWRSCGTSGRDTGSAGPTARPSALTLTRAVVVPEEPGTMVDRYKLLEQLGEGGFGVVWAAEQQSAGQATAWP